MRRFFEVSLTPFESFNSSPSSALAFGKVSLLRERLSPEDLRFLEECFMPFRSDTWRSPRPDSLLSGGLASEAGLIFFLLDDDILPSLLPTLLAELTMLARVKHFAVKASRTGWK